MMTSLSFLHEAAKTAVGDKILYQAQQSESGRILFFTVLAR
jgi:hypothetical protein